MSNCTATPGLHNDGCDCGSYIICPGCDKRLKRTTSGKYRKHSGCDFSQTVIPEEDECETPATSKSASSASSPPDDATASVEPVTPTTTCSPGGQVPEGDASTSASATPVLPGVTSYANTLNDLATTQLAAYKARVDANVTTKSAFSQPLPVEQPTLFSQPAGPRSEEPAQEMNDLGKELTARLKEMFYAYDNRRSADNRSAQVTMGPSEMGTPCDRRLALSFLRMPPVSPGGDGWAAFVGTCIHEGLARMFLWANAGTGRFAVETPLTFDSEVVPKGTADLIDRTLFMLDDHKCQGRWSRNKLKSVGPIPTYRVQAHVYAHGARQRGERIDHVAIISWPRDESTLDDLYVWTEPYRPDIVKAAFERVEGISGLAESKMEELTGILPLGTPEIQIKARVGGTFNIDSESCRFCPFYLPNARSITEGCNGKR